MKKMSFIFLFSAVILFAIVVRAGDKTFSGEIMDSQCAYLGGHEAMMNKEMNTPKACAIGCIKEGGVFVLYDTTEKKIYQLDDQKKPESFAGDKVTVTGTYDESTQTIRVTAIESRK